MRNDKMLECAAVLNVITYMEITELKPVWDMYSMSEWSVTSSIVASVNVV